MSEEVIIRNIAQFNAEMAKHPEYTAKTAGIIRQRVTTGLKMGFEVTYRTW